LDDVLSALLSERFYREGTKETGVIPVPILNSWRDNMRVLLSQIKAAIGNKLLIINTGLYATDFLAISDGQMYEAFCMQTGSHTENTIRDGKKIRFNDYCFSFWKDFPRPVRILDRATDSQMKNTQRYCFAMFLLGANSNSYFYFKPSMKYQGVTHFPEWMWILVLQLEVIRVGLDTIIPKRIFKRFGANQSFIRKCPSKFGTKYKNLDGVITDTITLGNREGEILLKISENTIPSATPK